MTCEQEILRRFDEVSGVSRFDSSADGSNLPFVRIASVGLAGILGLVGLIAWSCITGHVATGLAGVIALPLWMASGYIYLTILVLTNPASGYGKAKSKREPAKGTVIQPAPRPLPANRRRLSGAGALSGSVLP